MQKFGSIFCLLFSFSSYGQREQVQKIIWHNTGLQSVISSAKNIHSIAFKKNDNDKLEIRPDTSFLTDKRLVYGNWYSTVYLGHIYLFEKQFGMFPTDVLLKKLDSLRRQDCYFNVYEGYIYSDHTDIKITSSCPGKNKDRIFYKVENSPGFFGGPAAFRQLVQSRLACTDYKSYIQGDSALFFTVVVKKDSMAHNVLSLDSVNSPLRQIIKNALVNTYGWKPYNKDGRNMNAWLQVFIYIRKDGSIEADYLH